MPILAARYGLQERRCGPRRPTWPKGHPRPPRSPAGLQARDAVTIAGTPVTTTTITQVTAHADDGEERAGAERQQ